ncbi:pYEATS domain-containing protein [Rhizobium leguminosarum]|nr:hypothetical protein HB775_28590 [Rhizobium leguminosarum bv. trifolii]
MIQVLTSSERQHIHPAKKDSKPPRVGSALVVDDVDGLGKSQIAVVILSVDEGRDSELSEQIRLFNQTDSSIRSSATAVDAVQEQLGSQPTAEGGWWALKAYKTNPGSYRLRYRSHKGDAVDQIVPAFADRQTVIVLRKQTAQMLVPSGKAYRSVGFFGADPEAVTIFTKGAQNPLDDDQLRVTRLLLSYLRNSGPFPDKYLLRRARSKDADPLQRLYAAAVIVAGLNRPGDLSGHQEADNPSTMRETRLALIEKWAPVAEHLVAPLPQDMPDVFALKCRIAALKGIRPQGTKLLSPPMLALSWGWIAEQDVLHGNTIPKGIVFHAATEGRIPAEPWLAWLSAAAKFGTAQKQDHSNEDSDSEVTALAPGVEALLAISIAGISAAALSQSTWSIIAGAAAVGLVKDNLTSKRLGDLARSLAIPAFALQNRVALALRELSNIDFGHSLGSSDHSPTKSKRQMPPPLERPISRFDDPQKGRFGGRHSVAGFTLSVSFVEEDEDWIAIKLSISADNDADLLKGDKATFYLHDTFRPDNHTVGFVSRRSRLNLHAFGGFTVGVWLPRQEIELELDLAEIADAPTAIREW